MADPAAAATGPRQPPPVMLTRASSTSSANAAAPRQSSDSDSLDEKKDLALTPSAQNQPTNPPSTHPDDMDVVAEGRKKAAHSLNPLRRWRTIPPVPPARSESQETHASLLSQITFSWIADFMHVGFLRPLTLTDIPTVPPFRASATLTNTLQASFDRRLARGDTHPLLWALNETFFREFWLGGIARLWADVLLVMTPFTLKYLIRFATEAYAAQHTPGAEQPHVGRGVGLAVGIAVMQVTSSIAMGQFVYRGMVSGGQMRAALIGVIFRKSLHISARARAGGEAPPRGAEEDGEGGEDAGKKKKAEKKTEKKGKKNKDTKPPAEGWTNGHITNLMSTDTYRIDSVCAWFHIIWTTPLTMILTMIILLINISYSALAGIALLLIAAPVLGRVMRILMARRRQMNLITDQRVGLTQEILLGVRFVKYYAWEASFLGQLQKLRAEEVRAVQFLLGVRSGVNAVGMSLPVFAAMLSFITYSLTGNELNPANVFSSLALFNTLRLPLNLLPVVIGQVADAWVSVQRIEMFLRAEEVRENRTLQDIDSGAAAEIRGGGFTWEGNSGGNAAAAAGNGKGKGGGVAPGLKAEVKAAKKAARAEKKAEKKSGVNTDGSGSGTPPAGEEEHPSEPFQLKNINLSFGRSELVAVVGTVGSGKTSLLAALAGEMRQTSGEIRQASNLAYCPQYAWIQNASVRDNIVFGKAFDAEWYQKVVYACALQPDLDMLPDGDRTEIGERGITVSGGQKQRMNIARAIYFDAEIVLMDDPLSAVDAHVGRHLFDEAVCGLLGGKCRILATHQLHVLDRCDRVIWMEDGEVRAVGTYEELMKAEEGFRVLVGEYGRNKEEEPVEKTEAEAGGESDDEGSGGGEDGEKNRDQDTTSEIAKVESHKKKPPKAQAAPSKALMQTEERSTSSVGWAVYKAYITASGSILNAPGIILMLLLAQGANIMTALWLSYWTSDKFSLPNTTYIGIFAALGVAQSALLFGFAFWLTIAGTTSSKTLMGQAMERVLRAPMSFFDTTPIGRIINRFSKDVDVMDNNLTDAMRMYFLTLAIISSVCCLIIAFFPYFAVALGPLSILFFISASYYRASAREVKRHEAVLRSVVYAKFGEALTGIGTIRAYGLEARFITELHTAVDIMDSAYFITFANQRWLSLRLDTIGNLLVFTTGILVVTSRFSVAPSISGVVLTYILQIVMMIQWMIRQLAEVENAMNATERVHYYGTQLPEEAPLRTNAAVHLRPTWPEMGAISFQNVHMRYRPGLPLVLRGVDLEIRGGERIGVVGRTGAGKSSVMSALFRLVELEDGGRIMVDGVDIKTLGLHDLRTKLAIIPQDPTLFRGTIRSNLDPFGEHTDEQLWTALRKSYLVEDSPLGGGGGDPESTSTTPATQQQQQRLTLTTPVLDSGENFSLGQRQLMALARALVRNSRIIVCDEATSSVDAETDRRIQRTMREGFGGRTVLCIAHRLATVVGYDRVVVLEGGRVVEVGRPWELWRGGGRWRGMCERGGVVEEDFFRGGGVSEG